MFRSRGLILLRRFCAGCCALGGQCRLATRFNAGRLGALVLGITELQFRQGGREGASRYRR